MVSVYLSVGALLLAVLPACGKSAGSSCKPGEAFCSNKTTALACQGGKLAEVACRGPLGCTKYQEHPSCDDSIATDGEACMDRGDDEYACSSDKKRALVCKNGKFERYLECRGKAGCALFGQQLTCDNTIAAKAETCKVQGSSACSDDLKEMLICRDGKFAHYRHCRGQAGCYMKGDTPACDETLALEQDECGLPGYVVCSVDGQSELVCEGSRFMKIRTCKSGCTMINGGRGGIDCK